MNRLARNIAFCVKNNYKTLATTNTARPKLIICRNFANTKQCAVRKLLCEKISHNTAFATQVLQFSSDSASITITQLDYEKFCVETLESLCDYIEELVENVIHLSAADVLNKDGVLTVSLGSLYGTYVINKQSPNKQIWLSSPTSGPKRFDFVYAKDGSKNGFWVYKHTGETLHELLDDEFSEIARVQTHFQTLSFGLKC